MAVKKVAVVGAGVAGLTCAQKLVEAGINVVVFDKSRGVGGRMSTRRGDGWLCDHGAQYFTARSSGFLEQVMAWQDKRVVALWEPRLTVLEEGAVRGARVEFPRYVGTPSMTAPARLLAEGLDVRLQLAIKSIRKTPTGYILVSDDQTSIHEGFQAVVLAVPAPQALPLIEPLSQALAGAADAALMQACWALMLRFEHAPQLGFDAAFVNLGPLRWVARNSSKPERNGRETWVLHASPEWSEAHVDCSPEEVAARMLEAFVELGAKELPESWTAHRWRYAFTESAVPEGCVWDAEARLGLCGDWLNGGRVEGAWESGGKLARMILRSGTNP